MKHVSILVLQGAKVNSVEGPNEAFNEVNAMLKANERPPLFKTHLVGLTRKVQLNDGSYTVNTSMLLKEVKKTDLIIIPAMQGNLNDALQSNKEFIPWIVEQYKKGAEVASLCVGAFLLAATGLLKGKQCSTHWRAANNFQKMFPENWDWNCIR